MKIITRNDIAELSESEVESILRKHVEKETGRAAGRPAYSYRMDSTSQCLHISANFTLERIKGDSK
jgi:hypothetical protein